MSSHCRIGKIRMKAGGAEVKVLEGAPRTEVESSLLRTVRSTISSFTGVELAGYALVAWDDHGATSSAVCSLPHSPYSPQAIPLHAYTTLINHLSDEQAAEIFEA